MTLVSDTHGAHGAVYRDRGGRRVVDHYRKPERVGKAVRNVVGAIEMGYGVLAITGEDRVEFIDNAVSNRIPEADGQGRVRTPARSPGRHRDGHVRVQRRRAPPRLPPARAHRAVAEDWASKVFIQDVTIDDISDELGVFGVHGPKSTEKVASVLGGPGAPEKPLSFVRGSMVDAGVTVIASDAPLGEEGYEVVCAAEDAEEVLDTLLNRGLNAAPFGYRTWDALSLEAGTPSSSTSLKERCRTSSDSATPWTSRRGVTSVRRSSPALRIRDGRAGVSSDSTRRACRRDRRHRRRRRPGGVRRDPAVSRRGRVRRRRGGRRGDPRGGRTGRRRPDRVGVRPVRRRPRRSHRARRRRRSRGDALRPPVPVRRRERAVRAAADVSERRVVATVAVAVGACLRAPEGCEEHARGRGERSKSANREAGGEA